MPKLNGWERIQKGENSLGRRTVWQHDKQGLRLSVFNRKDKWVVELPETEIDDEEPSDELPKEIFGAKKDAFKFARDYMRENPLPEDQYGKWDDIMYSLLVPTEYNSGEEIESEELQYVIDRMIERFGGVTFEPVEGGYKYQGRTMYDQNLKIMALRRGEDGIPIQEDQVFLQELADYIGEQFGQAEVMMLEEPGMEADFIQGDFEEAR